MRTTHLTICVLTLAAALIGCRSEKNVGPDYPHLSTPYEGEGNFQGGGTAPPPETINGLWFNQGDAPGFLVGIESDDNGFRFNTPSGSVSNSVEFYIDYWVSGMSFIQQSGNVNGSQLVWTGTDFIDDATWTATFSNGRISGPFDQTWVGIPRPTHDIELISLPQLFDTASTQQIPSTETYELSPDNVNQVVKIDVVQPSIIFTAETAGSAGLNTWLWLFSSDGTFLRQNEERIGGGGNNADSVIQYTAEQGTYYFVITTMQDDTDEVEFKLSQLTIDN